MKVVDLAAPQGFEPRYADPESAVLPLNEGAANGWKRTIIIIDARSVRTLILLGCARDGQPSDPLN